MKMRKNLRIFLRKMEMKTKLETYKRERFEKKRIKGEGSKKNV